MTASASGRSFCRDTAGPKPDFADEEIVLARNALERGKDVGMRAVEIGEVKGAHAAVVSAAEKSFEMFFTGPGLVGLAVTAAHAGADTDPAELQARSAEGDGFISIVVGGWGRGRFGFEGITSQNAANPEGRGL